MQSQYILSVDRRSRCFTVAKTALRRLKPIERHALPVPINEKMLPSLRARAVSGEYASLYTDW